MTSAQCAKKCENHYKISRHCFQPNRLLNIQMCSSTLCTPPTAPAFTLLEGTEASAPKFTSYIVMYSIRNTSFERAFPPSGPCQHAFGNRRPSPPPPPDHFIFSEPPSYSASSPFKALKRKESRPNDTVRHPL